ncbi:MAG: MFS transporter [Acidimicrobiia bacterium]
MISETDGRPQRFRFGRLWSAAVASNLGDGLVLAAFPLIAAGLSTDPVAISIITAAAGLPWLIFGSVAGAIVDRFDRRKLMVAFDAARAIVVALFAIAVASDAVTLWATYLAVFLVATGETVVDTSSQSILPALVPREGLDVANGRLFSTMTLAHRFVGPPLGGWLFGLAVVLPIAADSVTFAVAALLMFSLSGRFGPEPEDTRRVGSIGSSVVEGFKWLWDNRPIRTFAIGAGLLNIGIMAGESILVLFARDQLGLGAIGFGSLFAALAAGYALGSGVAPLVTARFDRLMVIGVGVGLIALSLWAIATSRHWVPASAGLLGIGIGSGLWDVVAVSYRQAAVPDRLLGRIMSAYRVIAHGSVPVGAILGGVVAGLGGNAAAFAFGGVLVVVALVFVVINLRSVELDPALA